MVVRTSLSILPTINPRTVPELVESWLAWGSPEQCAAKLRQYVDVGVRMITLRLTGWDQIGQLQRCIEEVLPKI